MIVFYDKRMSSKLDSEWAPSASKPEKLMKHWKNALGDKIQVMGFQPATPEQIAIAHDLKWVGDVLACRSENGWRSKNRSVAESLPWTVGSILNATMFALDQNLSVCSPTSGFHHAGYSRASAFCTFNGLMVSALHMARLGFKVGIVDFDAHYGNGTDEILDRTKKNHRSLIKHWTFGLNPYKFGFDKFRKMLEEMGDTCNVILYQAGADPHKADPLGGYLSTDELQIRDEMVFRIMKKANVPVVWNLAGGYQTPIKKVLDLHTNTATTFLKVYEQVTV